MIRVFEYAYESDERYLSYVIRDDRRTHIPLGRFGASPLGILIGDTWVMLCCPSGRTAILKGCG